MNTLNIFNQFPQDYDLTILQTFFAKGAKQDNGRWSTPSISMVAKDNNTGKKYLKIRIFLIIMTIFLLKKSNLYNVQIDN